MIARQDVGMASQAKARHHTAEQLQEIPVCVIVRKQRSAVDSTIHDPRSATLWRYAEHIKRPIGSARRRRD